MQVRALALLCLLLCPVYRPLAAQTVPTVISHLYESSVDLSVSDDFNAPTLNTGKWGYRTEQRTANWLPSNVTIEDDGSGDQYLNLRGGWDRAPDASGIITGTGSSAGIYSRVASGFGFYTTRWRVEGIDPNFKSSWHPAIWKANVQPIPGWPRGGLPVNQIELDLVEFFQWRSGNNVQWHSQAIEWIWDGQSNTSERFQHNSWSGDFLDSFWNTHGLEYHPGYIQLWELNESTNQWSRRGARVTISEAPTNPTALNINEESAHPGYWILSNFDFFDTTNGYWQQFGAPDGVQRPIDVTDNFLMSDSALQVDHFRYYPLVTSDLDGDLDVDGTDYLAWQRAESPDPRSSDDLDGWERNYGRSPVPFQRLSAVPEPTSVLLAAVATFFAQMIRKK